MAQRVWAVVRREYLQRVRSRWFIFTTLGMPILTVAMIVGPSYLESRDECLERTLALVDATGELAGGEYGGFLVVDTQVAQQPVILFLVIPVLFLLPTIDDPGNQLFVWMSRFPLFSPVLMYARASVGAAAWWEIALSFVLMAATVVAIAWVAGRIYKVGILMAGKRATLPEIVRWAREAGRYSSSSPGSADRSSPAS